MLIINVCGLTLLARLVMQILTSFVYSGFVSFVLMCCPQYHIVAIPMENTVTSFRRSFAKLPVHHSVLCT